MTDHPILSRDELPFNPVRKSRKPAYPWDDLAPGQGFSFRSGTSIQYARNQASERGSALGRKFRTFISEGNDMLYCVRVDGIDYQPGRAGDGTMVRPTTLRMEFIPGTEDWGDYLERQERDRGVDRLRKALDCLSLQGFNEWIDTLIAQIEASGEVKDAEKEHGEV